MKITFIQPGITKAKGKPYFLNLKLVEPLTIASLKALTPKEIETEFYDDRQQLIDYETDTDLVAITVETFTARRAYQIADRFRNRGITVVMGGVHASLLPEEVMEHADVVFTGRALRTWNTFLNDFSKNKHQTLYSGTPEPYTYIPDKSIYSRKKYDTVFGMVEAGMGCINHCSFCTISTYYKSKYYPKDIDSIIHEIELQRRKAVFFVDDNLTANQSYALKLFERLADLKISWVGYGTIDIANNPKLLDSIRKSGCINLFIGFESITKKGLDQIGKEWTYQAGKTSDMIKTIHDKGINITAAFIFGLDCDTIDTIQRTVEFAINQRFAVALFNPVTPYPGTPIYKELKDTGRLILDKWWIDDDYHYGDVVFRPKQIRSDELRWSCDYASDEFYKASSIMKRAMACLGRTYSLKSLMGYLFYNISYNRFEKKMIGLKLGENLDELPK
jgi:radical SAM superfamily enzyme YgiQ (UPF0313 family)